jgi:4-amino-4-deoxy-L-arabinose transferase-like glycosyltransferase
MRRFFLLIAILLAVGTFLRLPPFLFSPSSLIHPAPGYRVIGFDEGIYWQYLNDLSDHGLSSYPEMAEKYVVEQSRTADTVLPPTRFLYIFSGYLWHCLTGQETMMSLRVVSSWFSIFLLLVGTIFAYRAGGPKIGAAVCALMAFAPTQVHMSQHALIDGVFAFWAVTSLWLLWENFQHPNDWRWLLPYGLSLAFMVLTKENAFFAYVALCAVVGVCFWQKYYPIGRFLIATMVIGPLLGLAVLINLCGSLSTTIHIYQLLVSKASVFPYAIKTGDGPWYRYLVDLLLVSPLVLILAWGGIFMLRRSDKIPVLLVTFMAASYLVMANVRYGMNLRYANMWDMPLRYLAVFGLTNVTDRFRTTARWLFPAAIAGLCLFEWHQYLVFFVRYGLYELVTKGLLEALKILK